MNLGTIILWLAAVVFGALGVGFSLAPSSWARIVDIALPTAMARTDLRATYGGFALGFGVFLAICAAREWLHQGLLACGLALLGFGAARLLGIVLEGGGTRLMWGFLSLELAGGILSLWTLTRIPS